LLESEVMTVDTNQAPDDLRVGPQSHLTLHYRISLADNAEPIINTFGGRPATLAFGLGQLAPPLEQCLIGMKEGEHKTFDLPAGAGFGERSPEMIQRVSRAMMAANGDPDEIWSSSRRPMGVVLPGCSRALMIKARYLTLIIRWQAAQCSLKSTYWEFSNEAS
jgi:hypothetical protein